MPIHRIYADIGELFTGAAILVLDANASAGGATITVKSIIGATTNTILFFREPGNESAEIVATHAVTAPSGNTVTLATNLVEAHPAGTVIYIIKANQVCFYHTATAVDANIDDATLVALAAAQAIDPTTKRNYIDDTVQTSGYYYYRFIDGVNSVNGIYSDPIPWGQSTVQFAPDEVGYVLEFVRRKLGRDWDDRFSKQDAMNEINACLNYIQGKLKRWGRYLVPDYALGQTKRGVFDWALPTDIYDGESNKSIVQVRIVGADDPLIPLDEREFDQLTGSVKHATVRIQLGVGDTSLAIDNSYDFSDSGTIHIFTGNVIDEITYTGVTRSVTAGVLTGIPATGDGSIAVAHDVGTNVWQDENEGKPIYFNVRQGRLRAWPLSDSQWINHNIALDYNQQVTQVDSEGDTIDATRYDAIKNWLLWQGKAYWRNNGVADLKDADFVLFQDILKTAIRTDVNGQKSKMKPKLNTINYHPTSGDRRFDYS